MKRRQKYEMWNWLTYSVVLIHDNFRLKNLLLMKKNKKLWVVDVIVPHSDAAENFAWSVTRRENSVYTCGKEGGRKEGGLEHNWRFTSSEYI